jgi:hypothetical protein
MARPPPPLIIDGIPKAGPARGTPFQVLAASVIGAVLLSFLASRGLPAWADAKGDSDIATTIADIAERWADGLERLGFTVPHDEVRKTVRRVELTRWQ